MKNKKMLIAYIVMGVLLLLLIGAGIMLVLGRQERADQLGTLGQLGDKVDDLMNDGQKKEQTIDSLEDSKAELERQVSELKAQLAKLEADFEDAGTVYAEEIAELKAQLEAKNAEIASLEADIARYETVYTIDVREQARLIDELVEYIETQCPYVRMEDTFELDDNDKKINITYKWVAVSDLMDEAIKELKDAGTGDDDIDEDEIRAEILAREDVFYPNVSVYYEDLATGYHFGYNDDYTYNSASVIKAPYILSVLEVISADEQAYISKLKAEGKQPELIDANGDGVAETEKFEYSNPIYDLSETVVYDSKTMLKSGSGKIKDMPDGTEFSYLDFIKYALEYSDNVAYQQLRNRFGFNTMYSLARRVGASSVLKNGNNMTAADAGKLFKAIYAFIEKDEKYGAIMAESMRKGNHTVIIPLGVTPSVALHKYGWDTDSYHDAAVVMGEKPYVLAVFSDLDKGGDEINAYLREIVKKINVLHKNFYR